MCTMIKQAIATTMTNGAGSVFVRLTTYVPVELHGRIDAEAERENRTRASLARRLLAEWASESPSGLEGSNS
ncbi:ribbon-helix-helix domain-containing protein [Streptomyces hokutonensis]|uniref:ribbon-helix-helix domain-containing protein n=1 Tax=Streptomyces hokutonensis TaxID=1306990 RepID=UPI00035D34AD|nr:ribbon-helix-helix domain-containing protein [Streptomyces hokutonensis]